MRGWVGVGVGVGVGVLVGVGVWVGVEVEVGVGVGEGVEVGVGVEVTVAVSMLATTATTAAVAGLGFSGGVIVLGLTSTTWLKLQADKMNRLIKSNEPVTPGRTDESKTLFKILAPFELHNKVSIQTDYADFVQNFLLISENEDSHVMLRPQPALCIIIFVNYNK